MKANKDIIFKLGLGLQLLLIPIAFLWHFGPEANYYNWILAGCMAAVIILFAWPQAAVVRLRRLRAIKLQFVLVLVVLALSWLGYAYFYHYTRQQCVAYPNAPTGPNHDMVGYYGPCSTNPELSYQNSAIYSVNWESLFERRWVMLLGPGISIGAAIALTGAFIALPTANLYRYQLDKKRVKGIKKEDLFV